MHDRYHITCGSCRFLWLFYFTTRHKKWPQRQIKVVPGMYWLVSHGIQQSISGPQLHSTDIKKQLSRYQITAINKINDKKYTFFANNIIAATGVHNLPGDYSVKSSGIKFSGGAHLILKDDPLKTNGNGILLPKTEDNRIMFVLPWFGNTIVGTTDTETFSGTLDRPRANNEDKEYIIRHIKKYFNVDNVEYISSWSGIRALIDNKLTSTKNVSRGHFFNNVDEKFIQISGGKLTGFRLIAKESLELLFSDNFELTPLSFTDEVLDLSLIHI